MVGAAVKGLSKILRKGLRKSPVLGKYTKKPRGTPTKAGLVHKRNLLRGDKDTPKASDFISRKADLRGVKAPKKPGYMEGAVTGATAATASALYLKNKKARKDAKAKEDKKLKKAMEQHKKKTKEKRKKYGKHHG